MSKRGFECPNCGSEFCSAVRFWRDGRQIDSFDAYACHDCGQVTRAGTTQAISPEWQPPRTVKKSKVATGQVDIFGKIENVRDVINPVPKFVEAPSGASVTVARFPVDATKEYREELHKMIQETNSSRSNRDRPTWYKYRKIRRGSNGI